MSGSTFTDVSADRLGGAVFGSGEQTVVTNCTFMRTSAQVSQHPSTGAAPPCPLRRAWACAQVSLPVSLPQLGGAIFASQLAILNSSQFVSSSASFGGGAVKGGSVIATSCTFLNNSAGLVRIPDSASPRLAGFMRSPPAPCQRWRFDPDGATDNPPGFAAGWQHRGGQRDRGGLRVRQVECRSGAEHRKCADAAALLSAVPW